MAEMLLTFLSPNDRVYASQQLDELDKEGITYEFNHKICKETYFNYTLIKNAYSAIQSNSIDASYFLLGREQSLLPAHFLQEMAWPNRPLKPIPNFKTKEVLPRTPIENMKRYYNYSMISILYRGKIRDSFKIKTSPDDSELINDCDLREALIADSHALNRLFKIRIDEIKSLEQTLRVSDENKNTNESIKGLFKRFI